MNIYNAIMLFCLSLGVFILGLIRSTNREFTWSPGMRAGDAVLNADRTEHIVLMPSTGGEHMQLQCGKLVPTSHLRLPENDDDGQTVCVACRDYDPNETQGMTQ